MIIIITAIITLVIMMVIGKPGKAVKNSLLEKAVELFSVIECHLSTTLQPNHDDCHDYHDDHDDHGDHGQHGQPDDY